MLDAASRGVLLALAAGLFAVLPPRGAEAEEPLRPLPSYDNLVAPLVENYCSACHADTEVEGGLSFDKLDGGDGFQKQRAEWQEVARRLRDGSMPPTDSDPVPDEERQKWLAWIEARLAEFDCSGPVDPGWVTLRRLNRDQYRNTIRDLLDIDFNPGEHFPPD